MSNKFIIESPEAIIVLPLKKETELETTYSCNDCDTEWSTNGNRPKCPSCRSEDWEELENE